MIEMRDDSVGAVFVDVYFWHRYYKFGVGD